jgi:hypothetical protein
MIVAATTTKVFKIPIVKNWSSIFGLKIAKGVASLNTY